jgi:hypothetical protein
MKITVSLTGRSIAKEAPLRARNARNSEIAAALRSIADQIANLGERDGRCTFGDLRGKFLIED